MQKKYVIFINAQYIYLWLFKNSANLNAASKHYNEPANITTNRPLHAISLFCFFIKYLAGTYRRNP